MAFLRRAGRFLENVGVSLQDKNAYVERRTSPRGPPPVGSASPTPSPNGRSPHPPAVVPSTRVVSLRGKEPTTAHQNFVASTASLVGDVRLAEHASAWYGATIRG